MEGGSIIWTTVPVSTENKENNLVSPFFEVSFFFCNLKSYFTWFLTRWRDFSWWKLRCSNSALGFFYRHPWEDDGVHKEFCFKSQLLQRCVQWCCLGLNEPVPHICLSIGNCIDCITVLHLIVWSTKKSAQAMLGMGFKCIKLLPLQDPFSITVSTYSKHFQLFDTTLSRAKPYVAMLWKKPF